MDEGRMGGVERNKRGNRGGLGDWAKLFPS